MATSTLSDARSGKTGSDEIAPAGSSALAAIRVEPVGLRLERATVSLGGPRCALCDTTIEIRPGEQVAIIGPSGAGKTTMLAVLGAALRPTSGRALIDGQDPWSMGQRAIRALRAKLFIAPQTPPLPPRQRVITAVLAGRLAHWSLAKALSSLVRPSDTALARDALAQFALEGKLWARVDRLSGGERQRVGLARALVAEAGAVLVDEPLSALDPTLADHAIDVLVASTKRRGATLVCNLHQVDQAIAKFPRVIGLRDGNVVFDRAPAGISPDEIRRLYHNRDLELVQPPAPQFDPAAPTGRRPTRCF